MTVRTAGNIVLEPSALLSWRASRCDTARHAGELEFRMVPIALILSAAVAAGTILFGRGAELQDPVARATATYMPEIRRAEAELKQAEANMRSTDLQVAQSKAEALEVKATTTEMEALEKKIDRLRTESHRDNA